VFFIAVTITGYYFILRSANTKFIRFINSYLIVTVVKLFLFIGVIFLYLLNNRQDAAAFAISFFVLYLCYMIFEVINRYHISNHHSIKVFPGNFYFFDKII